MSMMKHSFRFAAVCFALAMVTGCESTDGGGGNVSGGGYYGVGFYDPWYYGGYHDDVDVIVRPPSRPARPGSGPRPEQPIARPPTTSARPTPMPSIPSMSRGGGGGGRR